MSINQEFKDKMELDEVQDLEYWTRIGYVFDLTTTHLGKWIVSVRRLTLFDGELDVYLKGSQIYSTPQKAIDATIGKLNTRNEV